jgi:hypothetical protein
MSAIRWCSVAVLACGALAACDAIFGKELNPKFCAAHPDDPECRGDASQTCSSSAECAAPLVCDVGGTNTCVACTQQEDAACTGATPVCGDDHACRGCVAHAECADSNVCLPDGSCADSAQVAYVQAGGTGAQPCTKGAPCGTLQEGITAVNASRPYIKVMGSGTVVDGVSTTIDGKTVTIVADPGAKLDRTGDGPILVVRSNNTNVSIYDLEITGQTGLADAAIQLEPNGGVPMLSLVRVKIAGSQGRGISATGGSLNVTQSTLSGNTGGGISVMNGTFVIVGNVFFNNGNDTTLVGAVAIGAAQNVMNRLEFNSFTRNKAQDTIGTAIHCIAGIFTARNNIMSENGTLTNMEQVGGACMHAYSIVRPGMVPPGAGNSNADPLFLNTTTGDLHVQPGSPALRAADPNSDLTGPAARDIDGDLRISPADIGADEAP